MPCRSEPTLLPAPETHAVVAVLIAIVAGVVGSLGVAARGDAAPGPAIAPLATALGLLAAGIASELREALAS